MAGTSDVNGVAKTEYDPGTPSVDKHAFWSKEEDEAIWDCFTAEHKAKLLKYQSAGNMPMMRQIIACANLAGNLPSCNKHSLQLT